jgi:hypothetical protein
MGSRICRWPFSGIAEAWIGTLGQMGPSLRFPPKIVCLASGNRGTSRLSPVYPSPVYPSIE